MKTHISKRILAAALLIQLCLPWDAAYSGGGSFVFGGSPRTEAAIPCAGCRGTRPAALASVAPLPVPRPATARAATVMTFRTRGKSMGEACRSQFINAAGTYGDVGRKIASLINSEAYSGRFLNGRSLRAICPKYSRLTKEQQTQAWVWFWMVLANEESTCNASLRHPTHFPDGRVLNPKPGWGLFAAELYPQHRNWRGRMCQGNIRETSTQVNCAVHTMAATQLAKGRGVLWSGSYWGPVRRVNRQIMPNMRGFKSCF